MNHKRRLLALILVGTWILSVASVSGACPMQAAPRGPRAAATDLCCPQPLGQTVSAGAEHGAAVCTCCPQRRSDGWQATAPQPQRTNTDGLARSAPAVAIESPASACAAPQAIARCPTLPGSALLLTNTTGLRSPPAA